MEESYWVGGKRFDNKTAELKEEGAEKEKKADRVEFKRKETFT